MSTLDSSIVFNKLIQCFELQDSNVDDLWQNECYSNSIFGNQMRLLWLLFQFLKYKRLPLAFSMYANQKLKEIVEFVDEFLISRLSPIRILPFLKRSSSQYPLLLTWCLLDASVVHMPEHFFRRIFEVYFCNLPEFKFAYLDVIKLKSCLLSISSIFSAVSVKECELYSLYTSILTNPGRDYRAKFTQFCPSLQRSVTLLELIYIFAKQRYLRRKSNSFIKHSLDILSHWIRSSSTFYQWVSLSPVNPEFNALPDISNTDISYNNLAQSYYNLDICRSTLNRYIANLSIMSIDVPGKTNLTLLREFRNRLRHLSGCMRFTFFQIHPMATYSILLNSSADLPLLNSKAEKQILQSMFSSLGEQIKTKKEEIHSFLLNSYHDIIPYTSSLHIIE